MTHDYKRNGTTTLFAALETLQGRVVGECHERHRHQEFLRFLRRLDTEFPGDVPLHLIMDNYGTHKHAKVKAWLKRHSRFVSHFVPTSSSWMNLVEGWFGHLDNKAIRRGVFRGVADRPPSMRFSRPGTTILNPSCGPRPPNPFRKSSRAVGELWSRSSPAAPVPNPERAGSDCLVISQTLHWRIIRYVASSRAVNRHQGETVSRTPGEPGGISFATFPSCQRAGVHANALRRVLL
jgi:transposase